MLLVRDVLMGKRKGVKACLIQRYVFFCFDSIKTRFFGVFFGVFVVF